MARREEEGEGGLGSQGAHLETRLEVLKAPAINSGYGYKTNELTLMRSEREGRYDE